MKAIYLVLVYMFMIFGCSTDQNQDLSEAEIQKNEPHIAKVKEVITAGGYNYLQVTENKNDYWIAVPTMEVEVGETVYFSKFMIMEDFNSPTIDQTFDEILFVEDARKSPTPEEMKNIHSGTLSSEKQKISVTPLSDGKTVEQIFSEKADLNGKEVKVKGQVVKFNKQIMNRNWIHVQDGTGSGEEFDLVITSNDDVKVGDVIVAEGTVAVDKDFGAGYFFPVIIEEAEIRIE